MHGVLLAREGYEMQAYLIYSLEDGYIHNPPAAVECEDDQAAIERARKLLDDRPLARSGARSVKRVGPGTALIPWWRRPPPSPTIRAAPGMRHEPGTRSAHSRSTSARLSGHPGARPALLMVSGLGADAEADWHLSTGQAGADCVNGAVGG
jgi:hypothetical protein